MLTLAAFGGLAWVFWSPYETSDDAVGGAGQPSSDRDAVERKPAHAPSTGTRQVEADETLFPLVPGTEWRYRVTGPKSTVPSDLWTQQLVSAPSGETPGILEVGFNEERMQSRLFANHGAVHFSGLPFTAPLEVENTSEPITSGELIPNRLRAVEGAVWIMRTESRIIHRYRDKDGIRRDQAAEAVQTDRAIAGLYEGVTVPAGQYSALCVRWISRIAIKNKGRPVLEWLTAEPYRQETMWLAPGVGIVKRSIEYLKPGKRAQRVTFELQEFRQVAPTD